ncbi:MAG: hypothetical protein ACTHLW_01725 [Verrucomicrobiota bacterium]
MANQFPEDENETPFAFARRVAGNGLDRTREVDHHLEILVDDVRVTEQTPDRRGPMRFFEVQHSLPDELVSGKQKVSVEFQDWANIGVVSADSAALTKSGERKLKFKS